MKVYEMFPGCASSVIGSLFSMFTSKLMMMVTMIWKMLDSCNCSLSEGINVSEMISLILSSLALIQRGSAALMAIFTSGSTKVPKPRRLALADPTLTLRGRLSILRKRPSVVIWIVPLMLTLFIASVIVPAPEIRVVPKNPDVSCCPTILNCGKLT